MLRRILVPVDGSKLSERALGLATALCERTSATLMLVRASESPSPTCQTYLAELATPLMQRGIGVDTHVSPGLEPAEAILCDAREQHADLIVMTTHGRTGAGRWIFGSVAEHVVAGSRVPVMLQHAWDPGRRQLLLSEHPRLLVPLDGSCLAEAALVEAAGLARELDGELVLVGVETTPHDVLIAEDEVALHLDSVEPGRVTNLQDYLLDCSVQVAERWPELNIATASELGDPAIGITRATDETGAALVVMATHGRSGLARTAAGSVAGRVLAHVQVPLVLVTHTRAET